MKNILLSTLIIFLLITHVVAQTQPVITSWLRNTTNITGRHYVSGNSTPINDTYAANVQSVKYSANYVYVSCSGIPAYIIGPYLDGNPSQGGNNSNIYKIPLTPVQNTGTGTATTGGTIGVFINGVSLFDYRDGASYSASFGADRGGPLGSMGDGVWNRDAIVAERGGFDCAKGHPAMTNYHHHQNPSAFNLDKVVISTVCNTYLADGLYVINENVHSPLLGYAYDGFPIYGAYGYKNTGGTDGITRMKSSYSLRNITVRTHYADGTNVADGPAVSTTYFLGKYREDYQYNATSAATPDYLDEHNGRFCITPEYPSGIYCYFATVDDNWNSAYPYLIGPTFYGTKTVTRVASIGETTTTYNGVLPITLLNLQGKYDDKTVVLTWRTASEQNNSHFDVERSDDGITFYHIGKVAGAGNSTKPIEYNFIDNAPLKTVGYYRLKQCDFDGTFTFSKTIALYNTYKGMGISVFPNPTTDLIMVQAYEMLKTTQKVVLLDINGKTLMQKDFNQGSTICHLETETLYNGTYFLSVSDGKNNQIFKVVIYR